MREPMSIEDAEKLLRMTIQDAVKGGVRVAPGRWGVEFCGNGFQPAAYDCAVCAGATALMHSSMQAEAERLYPEHRGSMNDAMALLFGWTSLEVDSLTCGFDARGPISGRSPSHFELGARMHDYAKEIQEKP